jgi:hypothetical protein
MALNKKGMDLKAISRDQKAIDKLPNHGRASVNHAKSKALEGAKKESLNAWGQDAKTAREIRGHLRKEKKMKSFMKHADERFNAGY